LLILPSFTSSNSLFSFIELYPFFSYLKLWVELQITLNNRMVHLLVTSKRKLSVPNYGPNEWQLDRLSILSNMKRLYIVYSDDKIIKFWKKQKILGLMQGTNKFQNKCISDSSMQHAIYLFICFTIENALTLPDLWSGILKLNAALVLGKMSLTVTLVDTCQRVTHRNRLAWYQGMLQCK
jgi:hypothetical protein